MKGFKFGIILFKMITYTIEVGVLASVSLGRLYSYNVSHLHFSLSRPHTARDEYNFFEKKIKTKKHVILPRTWCI